MEDQVIARYLTFGNRDGGNDPPPINVEGVNFEDILCHRCRHRLSPNNTLRPLSHILPSDNLGAFATIISVPMVSTTNIYQDTSISIDINFSGCSIPSINCVVSIKIKYGKCKMNICIRYNVGAVFSHCKMKTINNS